MTFTILEDGDRMVMGKEYNLMKFGIGIWERKNSKFLDLIIKHTTDTFWPNKNRLGP